MATTPLPTVPLSTQDDVVSKRERSKIEFPYTDLEDAETIASAVHNLGTFCTVVQLATSLNNEADGGGFRGRLSGAKMFGLVEGEKGNVALTDLGSRLFDPQQLKAARVEAFLKVPLYNKVFEQFNGKTLPPNLGLEAAMVNMGVAQKQKERARQAFQRSAKLAGFLDLAPDRLSTPVLGRVPPPPGEKPLAPPPPPPPPGQSKREHDPLIEGLLHRLPPPESQWTMDARRKWLQAAANIFDIIYADSDTGAVLTIECKGTGSKEAK